MRSFGKVLGCFAVAASCTSQVAREPVQASTPVTTPTLGRRVPIEGATVDVGQPAAEVPDPGENLEPPPPLPDGTHVTVAALVVALERIAEKLEGAPTVLADYEAWIAHHGLAPSDRLFRDYVRVRLVFECVRDGGLWQLRWAITNEQPRSDEIWAAWAALDAFDPATEAATATAECDELSALFAHLVRRLGVQDVGLFWPTWNHVVAVWTVAGEDGPVRIVVPTSQIFLDRGATLGTDGFDPWKQKTIYEYRRRDVRDDARLPSVLARWFVARAWTELGRSQAELQADRNARSDRLGGS